VANVLWILQKIDLLNIVDILLVAAIVYMILLLLRGTQAIQLLRGVILLVLVVAVIGSLAGLTAFNWLIRTGGQFLAIAVAVVLQPELRRALERIGRAGTAALWKGREVELDQVIKEIASCAQHLSDRRHGALIVIERESGLQDVIESGVEIDSKVTDQLLQTIFFPNTALHDGAVIIRANRIVAAACVLPLAQNVSTGAHIGTRHRAALGITEQTDALAIVVSEETGTISLARSGRMARYLDERRLNTLLQSLLSPKVERKSTGLWRLLPYAWRPEKTDRRS